MSIQAQLFLGSATRLFNRHLIQPLLQDRLHTAAGGRVDEQGTTTGVDEPYPAVFLTVTEQCEYTAVALLPMSLFLQQVVDHHASFLADISRPVQEALRRPLTDSAVALGHMFRAGAVSTLAVAARMTGYPVAVAVDHHRGVAGMDFHRLLHQVVWHRVIVLVVFDVIIDMHSSLLDLGILIRLCWQGPQCRLIQLLELAAPGPRQLLEGSVVEIVQQEADSLVE